jgi:hypothetical protein
MVRKAGSRMAGKILTGSAAWTKAFEHVILHFSEKEIFEKGGQAATHGVFKAALRSRSALEALISTAVRRPSSIKVGKLAVHGVFDGRPCVLLEREFADVIGEELRREGGQIVSRTEAKILRIIMDVNGKPVTAFPVASFF